MKQISDEEKAYFEAAAAEVERQAMENPGVPIPVDPDVAEYMGAAEDDSLDTAEIIESHDIPWETV